ncbi:MAG: bifunctional nuclease family protein [Saprospiraceae bacterium]|jgi:bifunctional DNase/RNase|nr:bifunctional nuclease family protein [Saprospiraceae bacterium]
MTKRRSKIELEIIALSHSIANKQNYAIVLGEVNGARRLPIVIGGPEAQAIAVALERMIPSRPLTHDLFKHTLDTFEIKIEEVIISELLEGVFYAKLVCLHHGSTYEIDSRTSDALALAVRFECPIYTYDYILEEAGVMLEDQEGDPREELPIDYPEKQKSSQAQLSSYSDQALTNMLAAELENENYERAAQIRDELNRRKKSS